MQTAVKVIGNDLGFIIVHFKQNTDGRIGNSGIVVFLRSPGICELIDGHRNMRQICKTAQCLLKVTSVRK